MTTRISGLSTGLPVDTWVTDMLKPRKTQIDGLGQKSTLLEWKQDDYQAIYTKVSELGSLAFSDTLEKNLAPLAAMSTNESVATATVASGSSMFSHRLTVNQLADSVYLGSSGEVTPSGNDKSTLATQFGITSDFSVKINGKSISVSKDASINTFVSNINNANAGVTAVYNATVDRFFLSTTTKGAWDGEYGSRIDFAGTDSAGMTFFSDDLKLSVNANVASTAAITASGNAKTSLATQFGWTGSKATDTFTMDINGKTVTVDPTKNIDALITTINSTTDIGVTASYNENLDRVILTGTGTTPKVDLSANTTGTGFDFLTTDLKVMAKDSRMILGQDAIVDIDGASNMHVLDNEFTLGGVTYSLKGAGTTTVDVASDIDKAVETVQALVDKYNSVLSDILTEYKETRQKQSSTSVTNGFEYYMPLTDDQRAAMTDDQITAWETKAKKGMLCRSPILATILDKMRSAFSTPISGLTGDYTSASSIGINTAEGWESYKEGGKLYLDDTKLRTALASDPDILNKIFGTTGTTTSKQGVAVRLKTAMDDGKTSLEREAGIPGNDVSDDYLSEQINDYADQIYNLTLKMNDEEDRYYNQFSAMESALQKLSAQSSWLSQQTGSSSSSS